MKNIISFFFIVWSDANDCQVHFDILFLHPILKKQNPNGPPNFHESITSKPEKIDRLFIYII